MQQRDTPLGLGVYPSGERMLFHQCGSQPAVGTALLLAPGQHLAVDAVRGQFVGGQVDPPARQILVDVPEEIGQLEGFSERGGVRCRLFARGDRAQHRQQLQTDHFRRSVHIEVQRSTIGIVGDRQVHPHRSKKVVEQLPVQLVAAGGVHDGLDDRVVVGGLPLFHQPGEQRSRKCLQLLGALGRAAGVESVENVVGPAGEAVQRVHGRSLGR